MVTEELDEKRKQQLESIISAKSLDDTNEYTAPMQGNPLFGDWEDGRVYRDFPFSPQTQEKQPMGAIIQIADLDSEYDTPPQRKTAASGMTLDDHTPTPEEKKATSVDVGDYDDIPAVPEEETNEDEDAYDLETFFNLEPKLISQEVNEQFKKLASFEGFESWYGGELKKLFKQIQQQQVNSGKRFVANLRDIIIPIKSLTGTVMSNKFSEKLGKALMGLYNALTAFYNFITSEDEDRKLEELDFNGYRPEFEQLNETATEFFAPSEDEWEKINDFFEDSVSEAVDSLIDAYDEIEKRINQLKTGNKEDAKASINFIGSTRRNQEIISKLENQKIIDSGFWEYETDNILKDGPKQLKDSIEETQELISEKLKILSSAQSVIFTGKLGESIKKVKKIAEQKKNFRSLSETLKKSASQLNKYIDNPDLQEIKNTDKLEKLAPFIINMDEIVVPILNKILELKEDDSLDFKYTIIENYEFNKDEPKIDPAKAEHKFNTNEMLGPFVKKLIRYLHDPKSVELTEEKLAQEEEKLYRLKGMDNDELFTHFYAIAKKDAEKAKIKQTEEYELRHLLSMKYVLEDKESVDMGKDLLDIHHSPAGEVDYSGEYATWDSDSDRPLDTSSLPDKKDDDDREKATEKKKQSLYIELRTMLRVIGLIAKKYELKKYYYEDEINSQKNTTFLLKDLLGQSSLRNIYFKKDIIVDKAHKFVSDCKEKAKDAEKITGFLTEIKQYPNGDDEPPDSYHKKLRELISDSAVLKNINSLEDSKYYPWLKNNPTLIKI